MQKHFCDKCGKEMPPGMRDNVKVGLWQHVVSEPDAGTGEPAEEYDTYKVFHYDLCNDCAGKMTEMISGNNESKAFMIE